MELMEMINNQKMREFYKKYKVCNYDENGYIKSIPSFKCEIQKNRDKEDSRVKKSQEGFPFFHQVAQFEMSKNVSSETLKQELIIANDEGYHFPNGTFVKLIDRVTF